MKRKDQYEHSAMFFIIATVALIIILTLAAISAHAQKPVRTGYLIVTQTTKPRKTAVHKVTNCNVADSIVANHFGNSIKGFSTAEALENSPFYTHERRNFYLYVEKKQVIRAKSGKLKFKKLRK